ncbi:glutathione S-transferase N-terminal domain-containing protein [Undibacterium arcticum]
MRARLALKVSGVEVEMHEVSLRAKPQALLDCSPKGTVPVLRLADGTVIDQSLDIMRWALARNDPQAWLGQDGVTEQDWALIARNDGQFKQDLDRYKYAERFPQQPAVIYRRQAETFLAELEHRLALQPWLGGQRPGLADFAIFFRLSGSLPASTRTGSANRPTAICGAGWTSCWRRRCLSR